jgi:putative PEP-CTERM system TPR-repeat lipoprotein
MNEPEGLDFPKMLRGLPAALALAGLLATALGGCGQETPEALIDSAKAFASKGDHKAATIQLRNLLQKQPGNGQGRFLLGVALNEQGDYVAAEKELRKALEFQYSADAVYPALALALVRQGKAKEAIDELGARTLAEPQAEAALRTELGLAHLRVGRRDDARRAFEAALAAKPGYAKARLGQAMVLATDRDFPGAMKIVDDVLAAAPAMPDALELKADLLLAQNDADGALEVVDRVVKLQPNNSRARYVAASLRIQGRKFDEAAADIEAMRKTVPTDPRASYLDALLAFRRGDAAKTRDAAQQVLKTLPDHAPSLFLAGAADYQLRSFETAAEYARRVLKQHPQSAQAQVLLISTYISSGKPERVWELLTPLLSRAPDNATLLALAGSAAFANNDLASAVRYFERAAKIDKSSALTRAKLGSVRLAMGDIDRATKDLELASELDPSGTQPDLALIAVHVQRKEFADALKAVAVLEKKRPDDPLTYNVKGIIEMASGDKQGARAAFTKALELKLDYIPAARNLASLDIAEKDPAAARRRFESIIEKRPASDEALIGLASVQVATGSTPKEVETTLERAIAANPASVAAKFALAEHQLRKGDAKGAATTLQGVAAASPNDPRMLDLLGLAQHRAGDDSQAIETYRKLAILQPKSPGPLRRLASVQFGVKDYNGAIENLRKALALAPGELDVRVDIANVQVAAGRSADALAAARAIQKELPKAAVGFALEGNVHFAQKDWAKATVAYRDAMKRQPSAGLVTRLHAALEAQAKHAESQSLTASWIRENPNDVAVRTYLAERALRDKQYKEAATLYEAILAVQPQNVAALNNLAWLAMEAKDPAAVGHAEKAYALAPENAAVLDTYGWLLLQKGEVKRSVELLTKAVSRDPKNADMRLHLARALVEAKDKPAARKEIEALFASEASAEQRAEAQEMLKGIW